MIRQFAIVAPRRVGRTRIAMKVMRGLPLHRTCIYIGWNMQEATRVRREVGDGPIRGQRTFTSGRIHQEFSGRRYDALLLDGSLRDMQKVLTRASALYYAKDNALVVWLIEEGKAERARGPGLVPVHEWEKRWRAREADREHLLRLAAANGVNDPHTSHERDIAVIVDMLLNESNHGNPELFQGVLALPESP